MIPFCLPFVLGMVMGSDVFHHKNSQTDKKDSMEIVNTILKQMSNISRS